MKKFVLLVIKTLSLFLKKTKLGYGGTWPGHLLLRIYPQFLHNYLDLFTRGVFYVSGTNGKTTVSLLLSNVLREAGYTVAHNTSGANLLNGVASSVLEDLKVLKDSLPDVGVFEVDESVLCSMLSRKTPVALILLNLSRDQLDRFGEVSITFERWVECLSRIKKNALVIYNEDDPYLKNLPFAVMRAGGKKNITFKGFSLKKILAPSPLEGRYNQMNTNAVFLAGRAFKLSRQVILSGLRSSAPAFGRGEEIKIGSAVIKILLAKNPASFNENLYLALGFLHKKGGGVLFVLNDNIPDGRDVSWIYDINSDLLKEVCFQARSVFVSGSRAYDFALRLEIIGVTVPETSVSSDLESVLAEILSENTYYYVFPTYSAMLQVRSLLIGRKIL